jgi:hypothetical protein
VPSLVVGKSEPVAPSSPVVVTSSLGIRSATLYMYTAPVTVWFDMYVKAVEAT